MRNLKILAAYLAIFFMSDRLLAVNLCQNGSVTKMQRHVPLELALEGSKNKIIFFDQTPLANTKRITPGGKHLVITKESPWSSLEQRSQILEKLRQSDAHVEVFQLSWKASEKWIKMAEAGLIEYKYLGSAFSRYCISKKHSSHEPNKQEN